MPTDPQWIAIYLALTMSVLALVVSVFAAVRAQDTRDALERLVKSLRRVVGSSADGSSVDGSSTNGSSTGAHAARPTEVITSARMSTRPPLIPEDPQRLIAAPPQVLTPDGAVATGDWLQHYARPKAKITWPITWPGVVAEFYRRLGLDDEVAGYFYLADINKIKQHFSLVMVKITRQGITAGDRETLRVAHQNVRNRRGEPITDRILEKVIDVLVAVLSESGVPMEAIGDLGRMLTEADLRSVLVIEPAHTW